MKKLDTVYLVLVNADSTEGRGPMVPKVAAVDEAVAKRIADSLEPYGHSGQFCEVREMLLASSFEDFNNKIEWQEKQKALAKLSKRERELLGL